MSRVIQIGLILFASLGLAFAQPSGKGTIAGTIFDAASGRPVPLVLIKVDGMSDGKVTTDTEGKYTVILSPGKYKLRLTSLNHLETTIEDIEVKAGVTTDASSVLQQKAAATTLDVVENIGSLQTTAESVLLERKRSSSVSDSISKEDIKASTASDAAGALLCAAWASATRPPCSTTPWCRRRNPNGASCRSTCSLPRSSTASR